MSKELLETISKNDKSKITNLILSGNVDFQVVDAEGCNIALKMAELGDVELLKLLSKFKEFNEAILRPDNTGLFVIHRLITSPNNTKMECVRFLLQANPKLILLQTNNSEKRTIFHMLARSDSATSRILLRWFCDCAKAQELFDVVGMGDGNGLTPLGHAIVFQASMQARFLVCVGIRPPANDPKLDQYVIGQKVKQWIAYKSEEDYSDTDSEDENDYKYVKFEPALFNTKK